MDNQVGPIAQGRGHRHVRWHKPAGGKRRPRVIEATRDALVRGIEQRHGSLWLRVSRAVIVSGYPLSRALERVRALRTDGAESLLAMTTALLYLADIRTGFVGQPREGGGRWIRYTLRDLAQIAFGAQGDADLARASRALDMMVSLNWAFPTKQVRRHKGEGIFRSEAGIRRLNWSRICELACTVGHLRRDRAHADATHGRIPVLVKGGRGQPADRTVGAPAPVAGTHDRPTSTGDPPSRARAMEHIANILDRIKG